MKFYESRVYFCAICSMTLFYERRGEEMVLVHGVNLGFPCSNTVYKVPLVELERIESDARSESLRE